MKTTMWEKIPLDEIKIIEGKMGDESIKVSHPSLRRPRYFVLSRVGNYYSRYTKNQVDTYAEGYLLV